MNKIEIWHKHGSSFALACEKLNNIFLKKTDDDPKQIAFGIQTALQVLIDSFDIKVRIFTEIVKQLDGLQEEEFRANFKGRYIIFELKESFVLSDNSYALCSRMVTYILYIGRAIARYGTIEGEFIFGVGDFTTSADFGFCSNVNSVTLLPDPHFIGAAGYQPFKSQCKDNWISWDKRQELIFWRGSTTGVYIDEMFRDSYFDVVQRIKMCRLVRESLYKDMFDVGISNIIQIHDQDCIEYVNKFLKGGYIPKIDQLNYKCIFDIDGNSNAWGLLETMSTGACMVKISSPFKFKQWYYDDMIPWYHFIPVESHLSDLESASEWIQKNMDKVKIIANRSLQFASSITLDNEVEIAAKKIFDKSKYIK